MTKDRQAVLAVDIGGTKIIVAAILADGKFIFRKYYLTLAEDGPRDVIKRLSTAIKQLITRSESEDIDIVGVGVGIAGIVDQKTGRLTTSPNLPGWRNVAVKDTVSGASGRETYVINDASAAALGELCFGAGRGFSNMLYVTVSTGIGGGIILNGQLYTGTDGCAGEWGHMTIVPEGPKCHCGNFGCLEALASGWAIARDAVTRINAGQDSIIKDIVEGRTDDITAEIVGKAAMGGDRLACNIVDAAANYLGIGLANLVNIFNPELIVVGGGLSKMGNLLLNPARRVIREKAFLLPARTVRIVRAGLGSNAGIVGAAAYVFRQRVNGVTA